MTRWHIIFSIFGHLEEWKFAQKFKIFAKVSLQFCQILNYCSTNGQNNKILPKRRNFAKPGHTARLYPWTCRWLCLRRHVNVIPHPQKSRLKLFFNTSVVVVVNYLGHWKSINLKFGNVALKLIDHFLWLKKTFFRLHILRKKKFLFAGGWGY